MISPTITDRAGRSYSEEFILKALELAAEIGPGKAAVQLGINRESIRRWRHQRSRRFRGRAREFFED